MKTVPGLEELGGAIIVEEREDRCVGVLQW